MNFPSTGLSDQSPEANGMPVDGSHDMPAIRPFTVNRDATAGLFMTWNPFHRTRYLVAALGPKFLYSP